MPTVSVVIPTYNRGLFISQTVESVLAQTFRDLEVIVVDDGSTDGTVDLLAAQFNQRIRVERLPHNQGCSTARNVGWAMARGQFVAFLDSDDLWMPEKLTRQMPLFDSPGVVMSHCWVRKIDENGRPLVSESAELEQQFAEASRRGYDYGGITETWCRMYTSAVVLRRELLRETGGFDPRLWNFEDWDLLWHVARLGAVATLTEPLVLHRTHRGNTPTVWTEDAGQWLNVMRKHLLLSQPVEKNAVRNLLVNMALGEYWRRDLAASRRWMWRALRADPTLLLKPGYYVWGAPLLHACLPHFAASWLVARSGVDDYRTEDGKPT